MRTRHTVEDRAWVRGFGMALFLDFANELLITHAKGLQKDGGAS